MNYWQKICERMNNVPGLEEDVVKSFVSCLQEILGWTDGEIEQQYVTQIGNNNSMRPDLLLADKIVVEVKRQTVNLYNIHVLLQLDSYISRLRKSYGLLLGDRLTLFYDTVVGEDDEREARFVVECKFDEPDNRQAAELMEILAKENFSTQKLKDFCQRNTTEKSKSILAMAERTNHGGAGRGGRDKVVNDYWGRFLEEYAAKDKILGLMSQNAIKSDIFANENQIQELFGMDYGIQFGLAISNYAGCRKVEIRVKKEQNKRMFREKFRGSTEEIADEIARLGGTMRVKAKKEIVINFFFAVPGEVEEDYKVIFEKFQAFEKMILSRYL